MYSRNRPCKGIQLRAYDFDGYVKMNFGISGQFGHIMIFTICKKLRFIILKANWSLITEKSPLMNSKTADTNPVRFSSSALSFKGLLICNCVNHPLSMQHVSLLKNWFLNKRNVPTHDMPKGTVCLKALALASRPRSDALKQQRHCVRKLMVTEMWS